MPLAADDLTALADAALDAAAGCQAAELRVERIRSQTVRLRDAQRASPCLRPCEQGAAGGLPIRRRLTTCPTKRFA